MINVVVGTSPENPKTLQELADLAGLSIASVSRALSGTSGVSEKTRVRIQKLAAAHGFSPNLIARRLASGQSRRLGFIASDLNNPVYINYFHILEKILRKTDHELLIADSERDSRLETTHIEKMRASQVDGLFIFPVHEWDGSSRSRLTAGLRACKLPAVIFGVHGVPDADHAGTDESDAGALCADKLLSLGHRKILFVNIDDGANQPAAERLTGFRKRIGRQAKIHVIVSDKPNWKEEVIDAISAKGCTACVTTNPLDLFALYRPLAQSRICVPADVSLITFGDDYGFSKFLMPVPATIYPDHAEIARQAIEFLFARLQDPNLPYRSYRIRCALDPGESLAGV